MATSATPNTTAATPTCDSTQLFAAVVEKEGIDPNDPGYASLHAYGQGPGVYNPTCVGPWAIGAASFPETGLTDSTQLFHWVDGTWQEVQSLPTPYGSCHLRKAGVPEDVIPKLRSLEPSVDAQVCATAQKPAAPPAALVGTWYAHASSLTMRPDGTGALMTQDWKAPGGPMPTITAQLATVTATGASADVKVTISDSSTLPAGTVLHLEAKSPGVMMTGLPGISAPFGFCTEASQRTGACGA